MDADVNARNNQGQTALEIAMKQKHRAAKRRLLRNVGAKE